MHCFSFSFSLCGSLWLHCLCLAHSPFPQFDYYNSVLINERDANGNYVELGAEFVLESNAHFSNLMVNTSLSSVQLPTNVYNKGRPRPPMSSRLPTYLVVDRVVLVVLVQFNDLPPFS